MGYYYYNNRKRDKKSWKWMEFSLWFGIFVYFAFIYFAYTKAKSLNMMIGSMSFLPFSMLLFLLLVYFPTKRSLRIQKSASTLLETNRKGLIYKLFQNETRLAWRDIKESNIIFHEHPSIGMFPREFRLSYSKGKIKIDNDPAIDPFIGSIELLQDVKERAPKFKQVLIGFHDICPYCRTKKEKGIDLCKCGEKVKFIHIIKRPFYLLKEEIIMVIIASLLLGKMFLPFIAALLVIFLIVPIILMKRKVPKTINEYIEERKAQEAVFAKDEELSTTENGNDIDSNKDENKTDNEQVGEEAACETKDDVSGKEKTGEVA